MYVLLIAAALACRPGDQLIDWSARLPPGPFLADFIVTLNPFYARVLVYPPGRFDLVERCCDGRPLYSLRTTITDGRFCVGRSQPQMQYNIRLKLRPDEDA